MRRCFSREKGVANGQHFAHMTVKPVELQRIVRKVDPVFRSERCASSEDEHRKDPKSANPLLGPMLKLPI